MSKHICIERPDQEVLIDFLSFSPADGTHIEGASVSVKLEFNPHTQEAKLLITARDGGLNYGQVILDMALPVTVEEVEEESEQ